MMKKILTIILVFCISNITLFSQDISCNDLYDYVLENASYPSKINCFGSDLLIKVERYNIEGSGFVVAYIKQNSYDYKGEPYIFCGISSSNWMFFRSEGMSGSWGEAFHTYIMDYKCNCY